MSSAKKDIYLHEGDITPRSCYTKSYDTLTIHDRLEMALWCENNLSGLSIVPYYNNWWVVGNTFYFLDAREYTWFILKWG